MPSLLEQREFDSGTLCVWCANDTSAGSGRFVNRIPATTDISNSVFSRAKTLTDMFDYVKGYGCEQCYTYDPNQKED